MLEVLKKSIQFYKLATLNWDKPEDRQEMYKRDLASLPSVSHISSIYEFIGLYYDEPYFEFTKVADILLVHIMRHIVGLEDILSHIRNGLREKYDDNAVIKRFMSFVADRYFDLIKGNWSVDTYIEAIEANWDLLSEEVIRKYQTEMIKKIIRHQSGDLNLSLKYSKQLLSELMLRSSLFSKYFLEKLARHFGPDYYADVMGMAAGTASQGEMLNIRGKDKLNVFDTARIIKEYWNDFIPKELMEELINKTDEKGKEYLRSLLYIPVDGPNEFFMLDEDMRPINTEYKNVMFPVEMFIAKWNSMSQEDRDKWLKIFADFKVVPRIN